MTATGDVVHASAHEHPDLFWALRGGGGNFGIVTEFEFALHEVGPIVLGGVARVRVRARRWRCCAPTATIMEAADDDLGGCAVLHRAPPAPFVPAHLVGRPVVGIMVAAFGDLDRAARLVAPLRALGPVADAVAPMPYTVLQSLIDAGSPAGLQGKFESAFMDALPDAAIRDLLAVAEHVPSPFTEVLIQPLGGAYARVDRHATALAHRDAPWMYHALAQWPDPADTPLNRTWTERLVAAMAPHSRRATHPNHVSSDSRRAGALVLRRRDLRAARRGQGPLGPAQRVPPQPEHQAVNLKG